MKILKRIVLILMVLVAFIAVYFFTIRKLDNSLLESKGFLETDGGVEKSSDAPMLIPSSFKGKERFYLKVPAINGDTLLGYCDTGGGISFLMPGTKHLKNLEDKTRLGIAKGLMPVKYVLFNDMVQDPAFPKPILRRSFVIRNPFQRISSPCLILIPNDGEAKLGAEIQPEMGAFLGQDFFMGKSWTFDYLKQEIWLHTPLNASPAQTQNVQKLGFKKNIHGQKIFGHPSMQIEVDDEVIDVLFDTGATVVLSEEGKKQFETIEKSIGGSFIAASIFDAWRAKHPDWRYFPNADINRDMIEVPLVTIGSYKVGPVLFAKRPDEVWSEGMIHSMDKVVKGAIGGSALQYLKVTIDYNSELIRFEQPLITTE